MLALKLYNTICLGLWVSVLLLTGKVAVFERDRLLHQTNSEMFQLPIWLLRFVQTFQVLDVIFVLLKINKGSLAGAVMQSSGRLLVAWMFLSTSSSPIQAAHVMIAWSIADTTRSLFYLTKNPLTTFMRYNSFLFLYPFGIFGEMRLIEDYLARNKFTVTDNEVTLIRGIQVSLLVGFVYLFKYMLKNRSRALKQGESSATANSDDSGITSPPSRPVSGLSPRSSGPKRD